MRIRPRLLLMVAYYHLRGAQQWRLLALSLPLARLPQGSSAISGP
jgi:hypothetical protein